MNKPGKRRCAMLRFDILRALVAEDARSWGGSPHVVRSGGGYMFVPEGGWVDGVYVTEHPAYLGRLEDLLGEEVLRRLQEIRDLLWAMK